MNIKEFAQLIYGSSTTDWRTEACWGSGSASSFLSSLSVSTSNGKFDNLEVKSHTNLASFRPNLSISIAWGYPSREDFQEGWANQFPDPRASSDHLDFYYNGVLVHREIYVVVDGGRSYLPLPNQVFDKTTNQITALTVPKTKAEFYRLFNHLSSGHDYDRYFTQAGFQIVNEPWLEE